MLVARWVKLWNPPSIVLVFKGFGGGFKKRHQSHHGLLKKRDYFLNAFLKDGLPLLGVIDASPIAFNGCKHKKKRRKKRKFFKKASRI